jgi:hypothetical protein
MESSVNQAILRGNGLYFLECIVSWFVDFITTTKVKNEEPKISKSDL